MNGRTKWNWHVPPIPGGRGCPFWRAPERERPPLRARARAWIGYGAVIGVAAPLALHGWHGAEHLLCIGAAAFGWVALVAARLWRRVR